VGFELTIPVFEQAKSFDALDCAATVLGGKDTDSKYIKLAGEYSILFIFRDYPNAIYCHLLAPQEILKSSGNHLVVPSGSSHMASSV
jgi:hypothetical protein